MKLIGLAHSPYSARVRMLAYAKGVELEQVAPEGFRTAHYKRFNPLGKVPVLDTGDLLIPESTVIMEYLEDIHPQPALRPADPAQRAVMNLFYRFADIYIQPVLFPLFLQLTADPRDERGLLENIARLDAQLVVLDQLMERFGRETHNHLDLADCALAPILYFAVRVPAMLAGADALANAPRVAAWWQWVRSREPAARVLEEMEAHLRGTPQWTTTPY